MTHHSHVTPNQPFLIGVSGGTASGKSTVCQEIMKRVGVDNPRLVAIVSQDSFYMDLTEDQKRKANAGDFNFDHPDALDHSLMLQTLKDLKHSKAVSLAKYDFRTHSRSSEFIIVEPADVILVEGILIFYHSDVRQVFDMKLFVDTDPDTRLARRVQRDINERGRNLQNILHQYLNLVKPAYEEFCLPNKKYADVIIPRGAENRVAIDLIVQHILEILRGASRNRHDGPATLPLSISGDIVGTRTANRSTSDAIRPH